MIQRSAISLQVRCGAMLTGPRGAAPEGSRFDRAINWMHAVCEGLGHEPYLLEARRGRGQQLLGVLPLALVRSVLFGRFLVSLPYVNSAGVVAEDASTATPLIEGAVTLANELNVRYLELRHEAPCTHAALSHCLTGKVHMRLALPQTADDLWKRLHSKVRNQVRKAQGQDLTVDWGREELLGDFYAVFSRNMRDLGTPVYGRRLFASVLARFAESAEIGVVRLGRRAIAAALLVHEEGLPAAGVPAAGITQVPSASSLRSFNYTSANMLMYWHLLCRAIDRGQAAFDFGAAAQGAARTASKSNGAPCRRGPRGNTSSARAERTLCGLTTASMEWRSGCGGGFP